MLTKLFKQMSGHKLKTGIALLLIIAGGYFGYRSLAKDKNAVQYVTAAVEKGTLIVSVSGSGQVSVSDQVDIKPKVSGDIVYVGAKTGQEVKTGTLLAQIDVRDAQKAVRDAEIALETAKLELEELLSPPDELTLLKAENAVLEAKNSLEKLKLNQEIEYQKAKEATQEAEDDIEKAYQDSLNTTTNAFWDLPTIIATLKNVLYSDEIAESRWGGIGPYQPNESIYVNLFDSEDRDELYLFLDRAKGDYEIARENYDQNFKNYKNTSRYSENETIEALLNDTIETTKSITEAIKSEVNFLDLVVDYFSKKDIPVYNTITDYQSDLKSYTLKTNSHLSSLLSMQESLKDGLGAKLNAERDLAEIEKTYPLDLAAAQISLGEEEKSLADLKAGPDELEVRAKENAVQQKEDALLTAKQDLIDCSIYAPFDGVIAEIEVKKGDSVSVGTVMASIITKQKIAEISLNEVDAAKVKVGQKATLTFDALSELTISGEVVEIDTLGTVTQGVVSYGVKLALDTQDERIKSGMSITADIITESKQDVLVLPNGAVKSQGSSYYVELVDPALYSQKGGVEATEEMKQQLLANVSGAILPQPPKLQPVEIGLSSDLSTEIISGLKEGDIVVTSTVSSNKVQTTRTQGNQRFGAPGGEVQMFFR